MTEVKPVLWVNSDDLNNRNFVGINAVKEGHMDLGRYYTVPLVSFDDHERAVKALRAENERLRRESEGRLVALHDKAEETKQEWMRAERDQLAAARQPAGQEPDSVWDRELSAVMPSDFKDWWESPNERPRIAAGVIVSLREREALAWEQVNQQAVVHCDNCGCDWLDNGLNPVGCPYCKLSAETEKLRELSA